ncbi:hypothetical protein EYC84_011239 [Monilinia fructicola]|uniref:Uncharacterized protein n=1 Tax=Monilinia fructicola TaxID=38448 RepID=A0A5M9JAE4_MONFR|nr:hypothetical protein EYC84_011239 [Monilinia fructicola]
MRFPIHALGPTLNGINASLAFDISSAIKNISSIKMPFVHQEVWFQKSSLPRIGINIAETIIQLSSCEGHLFLLILVGILEEESANIKCFKNGHLTCNIHPPDIFSDYIEKETIIVAQSRVQRLTKAKFYPSASRIM